jgi:hypothetical protein
MWVNQLASASVGYVAPAILGVNARMSSLFGNNQAARGPRTFTNELGGFDRALSLAERATLAAYVNAKYPTLPPVTWS